MLFGRSVVCSFANISNQYNSRLLYLEIQNSGAFARIIVSNATTASGMRGWVDGAVLCVCFGASF